MTMTRTKVATALAATTALLILTTTPAMAKWTNHGGRGVFTGGAGTFTYETATVKCTSSTGEFRINAEGTANTLEGITWNECKSTIGIKAEVICKGLEMRQLNLEGEATGTALGTLDESCTIASAGCVITIGTAGNKELKAIALKKIGANTEAKANVSGITATTNGNIACTLGGAAKTKTTEAKEITSVIQEGTGLE